MKISVIVPNHGRDIKTLVSSVEMSSYPAELFIVDIGLERSAQRNFGIKKAIEKHGLENHCLLILDSDQAVSFRLIEECVKLINLGYSCLYIPEQIVAYSWFGKIRAFERMFYTGTAVDVPRFVRASCCPLFDENLHGPEDADWGNRIPGFRGTTKEHIYHMDDIGIVEYFKKKSYYAKSLKRFKKQNPDDKVLSLKYRCWTVFTERGKWQDLIRHPLLAFGVFLILIGRGVIYVKSKCRDSDA